MFKVNNRNTGTGCEICSTLTIMTRHSGVKTRQRRSGIFIINLKHILFFFLVLTLNYS